MDVYLSDIDECATETHICSVDAVCDNTKGSYNCTCKPGYSGDGRTCKGNLCISLLRNTCSENEIVLSLNWILMTYITFVLRGGNIRD